MACTHSISLFFDPKDGDGTFLCDAGTVTQQAAGRKTTLLHLVLSLKMNGAIHLLPLYALMVCTIIVTLLLLFQYRLLTNHDARCARLVSSVSRDDELLPHTDPAPHHLTWGADQMHFLKHAALNSWWWTKSRANSLECNKPLSESCKITIFFPVHKHNYSAVTNALLWPCCGCRM
jgi:hypothetical protein